MQSDPQASTASTPGQSVADEVMAQLKRDYPPGALKWVSSGVSWRGPVAVPLTQIDRSTGDWSAASDTRKISRFQARIRGGWRKPVVLVKTPGNPRLYAVDGHTRILASMALGVPVTAYVGTASTAHGDWEHAHSRQLEDS
jgi:hypothetical protein